MNIQLVIFFSILFFISEMTLMIVKRSKKMDSKVNNDKKSLLVLWILIPISISAGFMLANYQEWTTINLTLGFIGLIFFAVGGFIRWMAIIQLADDFTVDVAITKNHKLKVTGLYRIIRHPSYLGLLLIVFGLSLGMNSLYSVLIVIVPVFIALIYRINVEENELEKEFKTSYKDYKTKTKRIFPYVY